MPNWNYRAGSIENDPKFWHTIGSNIKVVSPTDTIKAECQKAISALNGELTYDNRASAKIALHKIMKNLL